MTKNKKALYVIGVIIAMGLGSFPISLYDHEFANSLHLVLNDDFATLIRPTLRI